MSSKFYAVREGRKPGIYSTWEECKLQVTGYKGAVYKSFPTREEAEKYINDHEIPVDFFNIAFNGEYLLEEEISIPLLEEPLGKGEVIIYVDGSVSGSKDKVGYGYIVYYKDEVYPGYGYSDDEDLLPLANVSGEILAVIHALDVVDSLDDVETIEIRYDYNGIKEWATGGWEAKNFFTATYVSIMQIFLLTHKNVRFKHIDGHTGEPGNEAADILSKVGCGVIKV